MTDEGSGERVHDQQEEPASEAGTGVRKGPVIRDKRASSRASSEDATPQEEMKQSQDTDQDEAAGTAEDLEKVSAERNQYLEDLQRMKAEFENYRKRILREQTDVVSRASATLVNNLLPVLDNFDLAVAAAEDTKDFERMLRGVEMVYGELREVLRAEGLVPIEAKGRRFDPSLHEAALEIPGDEDGTLIVTEILRPGYMFKGRVLRPAMVKVTRKSEGSSENK
jgi:molecular chaperone GrpE